MLDRLSAGLAARSIAILPGIWVGRWPKRARRFSPPLSEGKPDPDHETRAVQVLDLYAAAPIDGPVISLDPMRPINLQPNSARRLG